MHQPRTPLIPHCNRRQFMAGTGMAFALAGTPFLFAADEEVSLPKKTGATVRAIFLYPPSEVFSGKEDGWWSWPGNEFDAEGRQKQYVSELRKMEKRLGVKVVVDPKPVANKADAQRVAKELEGNPVDGVLLVMFYNRILSEADTLLAAADKLGIPAIFYVGLGVKHGQVSHYRRPGLYFIQSLDNFAAIENGLRMINAKKLMAQSKLLSITEAKEPREGTEKFFGTKVRVIPFAQYAAAFKSLTIPAETRNQFKSVVNGAREMRGITDESLENAMRAHCALKQLLREEAADGLTMNCLKRGMLKPCISFSLLNSALIPAACENDFPAMYTQLLGQLLTGRPGFQHNPAFDTEKNHYYASHCTCATKLRGPDGKDVPYLLRRFAHTNEGSTAIQTFWPDGEAVSMMRYYPGKAPALDVYAGKVVKSHPMPPAAGCTTNVEIAITDRRDAREVKGHHNVLFLGDHTRTFRLFAQLYRMRLADTGYTGRFPV